MLSKGLGCWARRIYLPCRRADLGLLDVVEPLAMAGGKDQFVADVIIFLV